MEYYKIFDLDREPFANTPDPDFFFEAPGHVRCLQSIEMGVRLRRGLNIVLGQVGTGKTTLCRRFLRSLARDESIKPCLILDPYFSSTREFLLVLTKLFGMPEEPPTVSEWQIKENIKTRLFELGVEQNKTLVLAIDEGQKLTPECMEVLRELLNYETNRFKLLQIVIFAQPEFLPIIKSLQNFEDRINHLHVLEPLSFLETAAMVRFRLQKASESRPELRRSFFSWPALWRIYRTTGGYPRKIVNLCHKAFMAMIIQNTARASSALVKNCLTKPVKKTRPILTVNIAAALVLVALGIGAGVLFWPEPAQTPRSVRQPVDKAGPLASVEGPDSRQETSTAPEPEPIPETSVESLSAMEEPTPAQQHAEPLEAAPNGQPDPVESKPAMEETLHFPFNASTQAEPPAEPAVEPVTPQSAEETTPAPKPEPLTEPQPAPAPLRRSSPPTDLGSVVIQEGFVPYLIARRATGLRDIKDLAPYMDVLRKRNSHITDIGLVEVGQRLILPAVPMETLAKERFFVVLDTATDLERALAKAREADQNPAGPLAMLSFVLPGEETVQFALVLPSHFSQRDRALRSLASLPERVRSEARILTLPPKTVLYASIPGDRNAL
ncbi:MAG: hypothetical protein EOM25_10385 [Deltaproteobacteria bacterium]|nr:hypothetical protein [Deltaproteobacteria bacterium]